MKIQLLNKIAKIGLNQLDPTYEVGEAMENPDGIMVRSAVMHDMEFGNNLKAIARAGAGVNNIPLDRCAENGIVVFNTPGANANGVKELAICALLLASRNVVGGVNWANTLTTDVAKAVEKGKSQFAGTEIKGKTLGIIGLGAIGGMLANAAIALGMNVVGCDPFLSVNGAWNMNPQVKRVDTFDDVFAISDYITLHVPATKDTKNMINATSIAKMKDGVKLLNLARADLVNAEELKQALTSGKVSAYVTDFPTEEVINVPNIIAIPHLGASTEEAEDNCAIMAANELTDYLNNGNIKNSVNFPAVALPKTNNQRICVLFAADKDVLANVNTTLANKNFTIVNMASATKGTTGYAIIDVAQNDATIANDLANINGVYKVIIL